jgi:hypothetical protein
MREDKVFETLGVLVFAALAVLAWVVWRTALALWEFVAWALTPAERLTYTVEIEERRPAGKRATHDELKELFQ